MDNLLNIRKIILDNVLILKNLVKQINDLSIIIDDINEENIDVKYKLKQIRNNINKSIGKLIYETYDTFAVYEKLRIIFYN